MKHNKVLFSIFLAFFVGISLLFVLLPRPTADLYVRIYFEEIAGDQMHLYYATDTNNIFSQEQCLSTRIDTEDKVASFCLDKSLCGHLTGLRFDFAAKEDLIGIKSIALSSAGVVQKEYDPVDFFAPESIADTNEIDMSLIKVKNRVYVATKGSDPYIVMSPVIVREIAGHFSHYRLTRLLVCLFVWGVAWLTKKNIFGSK